LLKRKQKLIDSNTIIKNCAAILDNFIPGIFDIITVGIDEVIKEGISELITKYELSDPCLGEDVSE
jgi:hypothetical protein